MTSSRPTADIRSRRTSSRPLHPEDSADKAQDSATEQYWRIRTILEFFKLLVWISCQVFWDHIQHGLSATVSAEAKINPPPTLLTRCGRPHLPRWERDTPVGAIQTWVFC
jgi:hypothetical protein